MTDTDTDTRSVVVERELAAPPEQVWRALTQSELIGQWLMKTDFAPVEGHRFGFIADWGSIECQVHAIEPHRMLSYSWTSLGLDSVVTFTLTPAGAGTTLRVEQHGFRPDQQQAFQGAKFGWARFLGRLEQLLAETAEEGRVP